MQENAMAPQRIPDTIFFINTNSIYRNVVIKYGLETVLDVEVNGLHVHLMRATAATNALSHEADITKVPEWLGHVNASTTRLYGRRKTRPEIHRPFESDINKASG